jgi:hypothetical protein
MSDFLRDFNKQFEAQKDADKQTIKRADALYVAWRNRTFTLNEKANKESIVLRSTESYTNWLGQQKRRERKQPMTVADLWINSVFEYEKHRGSPYEWKGVASELNFAYDTAYGKDCLGGTSENEMLKLKDEVSDLSARLEVSNKNIAKFENRFIKTNDALIVIHNRLLDYEKELSDIRGKDIRASFDNSTTGVLQGKFGDDDDA